MNTNDYIRQVAQKCNWNKYYSIMRSVSIGTHHKASMMDFINYDTRTEINGRMVWLSCIITGELTQKEKPSFINGTVKEILDKCGIKTVVEGIGWRIA